MDGTRKARIFWRITLPLLGPNLLVVIVLALIRAVQVFDEVYVLTGGGPGTSTTFLTQYIYETGFASNLLFWLQTGYFDGAAELKPLLHTWSLAVEEQFYIVFPLVLAATWRWLGGRAVAVCAGLAAISFALSPNASAFWNERIISALLSSALVGMQPQLRQVPPARSSSMQATFLPSCPARIAPA